MNRAESRREKLDLLYIWSSSNTRSNMIMDSIQVLQSSAAKLVLDWSPYSSSSEALSHLNWMNLSARKQMQRCIHICNLVNDSSRNDIIVRGQYYHSYNTRSMEIIRITKSVTNWGLLRSFNSVLADWMTCRQQQKNYL